MGYIQTMAATTCPVTGAATNAQVSGALVWQCTKRGNAFSVRSMNNVWMSKERGNLYSVHSYKYSGVANEHAMALEDAREGLRATMSTVSALGSNPCAAMKTDDAVTLKADFKSMARSVASEAKKS